MRGIELIYRSLLHNGIAARASRSAASIRTTATTASSGARRSTSSRPAVEARARAACPRDGPFPPTPSSCKCRREERSYDAIVTMYHDQGQIAMKLMGF